MAQHRRLAAWYFWYFAFIGAFQPYFSLYLQSIGFAAGRIAVLMSLGQFMRLLAPLLWSWLADSGGRRVRVVVGSSAAALASFLVVFARQDFLALLIGMGVMHFFLSASLPLVEALTLGHLGKHPEGYGRIRLWGSVGFIAAVSGVGLMLDVAPMESLLWVSVALLLGTFLCATSLAEAPLPSSHGDGPLLAVLRSRRVVFLFAAGMFMTAAHGPLYVFYSIHMVALGYGKAAVGLLWTLGVVAEIVVFLFMPRLTVHVSKRVILLACFALAMLRFVLIGWLAEVVAIAVLAQLLHGASFGAHHAATMSALNRWFAPGQQARAQALYGSVAYGAGGLGGALLAGELWQRGGAATSFSAASVLAFVGLLLVWRGVPPDSSVPAVR